MLFIVTASRQLILCVAERLSSRTEEEEEEEEYQGGVGGVASTLGPHQLQGLQLGVILTRLAPVSLAKEQSGNVSARRFDAEDVSESKVRSVGRLQEVGGYLCSPSHR